MLRACWVKLFIAFLVVGFLEQNICSDARFFKLSVIFNSSCRNIYVNTADCTIFVFDTVDCLDTFQDVFDRVIYRVFA